MANTMVSAGKVAVEDGIIHPVLNFRVQDSSDNPYLNDCSKGLTRLTGLP